MIYKFYIIKCTVNSASVSKQQLLGDHLGSSHRGCRVQHRGEAPPSSTMDRRAPQTIKDP